MRTGMLRFPARRHAVTASLKITDIGPAVSALRREMAELLRAFAAEQEPDVAQALRQVADLFEPPAVPPEPPKVVPLRRP